MINYIFVFYLIFQRMKLNIKIKFDEIIVIKLKFSFLKKKII